MKTSELAKLLKKHGCKFMEHRGEHDWWCNPDTGREFPIPRHPSKEIPTGTANKIMKDAGLK